jgi:hypothetical protein
VTADLHVVAPGGEDASSVIRRSRFNRVVTVSRPSFPEEPMSEADLKAELEKLKAENEALKKKVPGKIGVSMKVSEKGGLSVYGLGRFPVTLYMEQWEKLLALADDIKTFIADNQDKLKKKEG